MKQAVFTAFAIFTQLSLALVLLPSEPIVSSRDCILGIMAQKMEVPLISEIPVPIIRTQNETPLEEYQVTMKDYWGFRPESFTNAFHPPTNQIFIMTEKDYYEKHERFVLDSLAHEIVHFIQHAYQGADLQQEDSFFEIEAIVLQNWFRDTYQELLQQGRPLCP